MPLNPSESESPSDLAPMQPACQSGNLTTHSEIVMILDWDDTLLCSSHLQHSGYRLDTCLYDLSRDLISSDSAETRAHQIMALQLRELESCVLQLLKQCISTATRTLIITNAEEGWVQLSASKFMPAIVPYLSLVQIISARSTYEPLWRDSPLRWKYSAMHEALIGGRFFGDDGRADVDKHVCSLGDSHVEREAVRAITRGIPSTRTKSVKFEARPTAEQLRRQLELVVACFDYIVHAAQDLDLQLTVTTPPDSGANSSSSSPSSTPIPTTPQSTADDKSTVSTPTATATDTITADIEAKEASTPMHVQSCLNQKLERHEGLTGAGAGAGQRTEQMVS